MMRKILTVSAVIVAILAMFTSAYAQSGSGAAMTRGCRGQTQVTGTSIRGV